MVYIPHVEEVTNFKTPKLSSPDPMTSFPIKGHSYIQIIFILCILSTVITPFN